MAETSTDPATRGRRTLLIAALAVLVAAAVAGGVYALTRSPGKARVPVAATASATPTHLDEGAACAIAAPAAADGALIVKDFIDHPDGSTVDQPTLDRTVTALAQVLAYGPPDLHELVANLHDPLAALQASFADHESRQIQTLQAGLAAQSIRDQCGDYTG